ncbi:hypothetical protein NDU88_000348 [Pleurodeles waltl]|uniref:Uncharacterized protein n=1 Tax=Pleurodeles waltl TaxID=8319 RepID=A0AAV7UR21_PLEWA|nr:hypothetical protein NDU88_000348 [Pleurodeles waltl]
MCKSEPHHRASLLLRSLQGEHTPPSRVSVGRSRFPETQAPSPWRCRSSLPGTRVSGKGSSARIRASLGVQVSCTAPAIAPHRQCPLAFSSNRALA